MHSFGVSESLILAGSFILSTGRVTEGWVMVAAGVLTGFVRFTSWFGLKSQENKDD